MKQTRTSCVLGLLLMMACGAEDQEAGQPEVARRLAECQSTLQRSQTATDMCEKKRGGEGGAGEWVIRIEGDTARVAGRSRGRAGDGMNMTPQQAAHLTEQFHAQVGKSRGAIQQCYVAALKKNESIQKRSIKLKVNVLVTATGRIINPSFAPKVSNDFTRCMKGVANRWKISHKGGSIRLQYPMTLTPT